MNKISKLLQKKQHSLPQLKLIGGQKYKAATIFNFPFGTLELNSILIIII